MVVGLRNEGMGFLVGGCGRGGVWDGMGVWFGLVGDGKVGFVWFGGGNCDRDVVEVWRGGLCRMNDLG